MKPHEPQWPSSSFFKLGERTCCVLSVAWACIRALLLLFAMLTATLVTFVAVDKAYSICPEQDVARVFYGRFCRSFWWSLGNHAVATSFLALVALAFPRLGRALRLVLVNVPLAALIMTLAGLCHRALDTAGVEGAESIFLGWKDDVYIAWGLVLGGVAAFQYVAWRRDGKPVQTKDAT